MSITFEELQKLEDLDLKKHLQIVDGYIATGLELDDITIHYAVDQERIALVLHSYGFGLGSLFGDEKDARKNYKGVPFHMIEEFVSAYFPGFLTESEDTAITLDDFLAMHYPDWKSQISKTKSSIFYLSQDEMQGKSYFQSHTKKSRNKFLVTLRNRIEKTK